MRRVAEIVAILAATVVFATSASASGVPTTGQPIRLLNPEATPPTFAANTPFHVRHGWTCLAEERATCLDPTTEFRLYVDGRRITSALDLELNLVCPDGLHTDCSAKRNVTNVRLGLTAGQHTFRGEWWASGDLRIVREAAIQFVS